MSHDIHRSYIQSSLSPYRHQSYSLDKSSEKISKSTWLPSSAYHVDSKNEKPVTHLDYIVDEIMEKIKANLPTLKKHDDSHHSSLHTYSPYRKNHTLYHSSISPHSTFTFGGYNSHLHKKDALFHSTMIPHSSFSLGASKSHHHKKDTLFHSTLIPHSSFSLGTSNSHHHHKNRFGHSELVSTTTYRHGHRNDYAKKNTELSLINELVDNSLKRSRLARSQSRSKQTAVYSSIYDIKDNIHRKHEDITIASHSMLKTAPLAWRSREILDTDEKSDNIKSKSYSIGFYKPKKTGIYEGETDLQGQRDGWGTLKDGEKVLYQGYWKNDHYHGDGVETNENINLKKDRLEQISHEKIDLNELPWAKFEGNFEFGVKNGFAKVTFIDNSVFSGSFKNGIVDGVGIFRYSNGTEVSGIWKNGQYHSQL